MEKSDFVWINNNFVPWEKSKVHFLVHALHYGTAVFEGIRAYKTNNGPAIFRLEEHVQRLFNSAKIFGIKIPFTKEKIYDAIIQTVEKNKLKECYIRPLAYYGYGGLGFDVSEQKVDVGISAWKWGTLLGKEKTENGMNVKISPFLRPASNVMPVTAKVSGNYANSIMAKMDAIKTGFDDAILFDNNGFVAECSAENFFMIKNNKIITPTIENCLNGITRQTIIQIAKDKNYQIEEKRIFKLEVMDADECFACGTAAEIVPITSIDKQKIGDGPGKITKELQKEYSKIIRGKKEKYSNWLTYVK
jgi:branched-chain amino acid aminotransferase